MRFWRTARVDTEKVKLVRMLVWVGPAHLVLVQNEKRKRDILWQLPGGKVEQGETFTQAAIRECEEEAGLTIREDQLRLRFASCPTEDRKNTIFIFDALLPKNTIVPGYGRVTGEKTGVFDRSKFMAHGTLVPEHISILEEAGFSEFPRPIHFLKPRT